MKCRNALQARYGPHQTALLPRAHQNNVKQSSFLLETRQYYSEILKK